jgi:two-component system, chemotaxis family, protein-glutamate methylesterase/glutaminase
VGKPTIRVLIVDESPFLRALVRGALADCTDIEVVGFASIEQEALDKIGRLEPEVVAIDVGLCERGGFALLDQVRQSQRTSAVMLTSLAADSAASTLEGLERGAFDYAVKPRKMGVDGIPRFGEILREKIVLAARARTNRHFPGAAAAPVPESASAEIETDRVVALGIGSGGPQTLLRVLPAFPAGFPAILVAQHMPPYLSKALADRLAKACRMSVREATDGEPVEPGTILLSPGGMHMEVIRQRDELRVRLDGGPRVSGHRPSADLLFESLAVACGPRAVAVIMTGSGRDGVRGLSKAHQAGAQTLAQDRATSACFAMAAAAIRTGVVDRTVPSTAIPGVVAALLRQNSPEPVLRA